MYNLELTQKNLNNLINVLSEDILARSKNLLHLYKEADEYYQKDNYKGEYNATLRSIEYKKKLLEDSNIQLLELLELNNEYYNPYCRFELNIIKSLGINKDIYNFFIYGGDNGL